MLVTSSVRTTNWLQPSFYFVSLNFFSKTNGLTFHLGVWNLERLSSASMFILSNKLLRDRDNRDLFRQLKSNALEQVCNNAIKNLIDSVLLLSADLRKFWLQKNTS